MPTTRDRRMQWEPLYEVTQIKGDGEAHPLLSPNDEFADYYNWDKGNFGFQAKTPEMLPHEYGRSALKRGLEQAEKLGTNPFKFGMIGSTDSHTSLATTREDNFFGKFSGVEPGTGEIRYDDVVVTDRRPNNNGEITIRHWQIAPPPAWLASGRARTRARRSGTPWRARKSTPPPAPGCWSGSSPAGILRRTRCIGPTSPTRATRGACPMGGDLTPAPEGAAPTFMIRALRDPDGANLDRIQIVKGWLDANGEAEEQDLRRGLGWRSRVGSGRQAAARRQHRGRRDRRPTPTTSAQAVMAGFWEDPDFDPSQRAFYYVRVLEIPTPSWLAYDRQSSACRCRKAPCSSQQERAYTSPIWYTPAG